MTCTPIPGNTVPERGLDTDIRVDQDGILCSYEEGGRGLDTGIRVDQDGILGSYEEGG